MRRAPPWRPAASPSSRSFRRRPAGHPRPPAGTLLAATSQGTGLPFQRDWRTSMKKLTAACAALALALTAVPVAADHPGGATTSDMQRLQDDLYNLDEALAAIPASHPRA